MRQAWEEVWSVRRLGLARGCDRLEFGLSGRLGLTKAGPSRE
jgi:hypothetical protein